MSTPDPTTQETPSREKLESLRSALGVADIGYWTWHPDGSMSWDPTFEKLVGFTHTRRKRTITDLLVHIVENEQIGLLDALQSSSMKQEPLDITITVQLRNKAHRTVRLVGNADSTGVKESRLSGLCLAAPTAHKTGARVTNSTIEDFFIHSNVLMAELDLSGNFLRTNAAWGKFLGTRHEQLNGQSFLNFLHPDNLPNTKLWLKQLGQRQDPNDMRPTTQGELSAQIHTSDKGNREIEWTWTADLNAKRIFTITRDVTETYEEETELTKDLAQAHASNTELESFASTASHDLREPLRMISSYLKLLQERYPEALDSRGRRYIDYASKGADRMRTLIDDLLAYSRISKETVAHEAVALEDIIGDAIDNLAIAIRQSKAEITVDIDNAPVVNGDAIKLTRLFQNLLGNAIKFQDEGSIPIVKISFSDGSTIGKPSKHIVSIRDNGIGIDPDHRDILFNLFQRLNTRDDFEGSGIGLSVCEKIVKQHSGEIWLRSFPKQGSTFNVSLPKPKNEKI
ncbi:MAG: ATP-binding protein [Opitutaceae bacterium]